MSFDLWTIDKKIADTELEYQDDIGSTANFHSTKFSKVAHRTVARASAADKKTVDIEIFKDIDV